MLSKPISTDARPAWNLVRRLTLLWLAVCWAAKAASANSVVTIEGADPAGPYVVLMAAAPATEASVGIARQMATVPLERGKLGIVETEAIPSGDALADFLAKAIPPGDLPDWVWVHGGSAGTDARGEKLASPTIRLYAKHIADKPVFKMLCLLLRNRSIGSKQQHVPTVRCPATGQVVGSVGLCGAVEPVIVDGRIDSLRCAKRHGTGQ